jgi:glycosyltransferase involved in cell wall biosynthesis
MESEIRENIPLMFYHVWDDLPFPKYNENYYRSCDFIASISKQTHNIVKNVWQKEPKWEPWQVKYIGHGVNPNTFKPMRTDEERAEVEKLKKEMFGEQPVEFVVLYNNRNIRRKMTGDVILAFKKFVDGLPKEKADKCWLVLHTQPIDDNGTDLPRVIADLAPNIKYIFSAGRVGADQLNKLYNVADATINLCSNEGFGLATLESIMAGTMIVANVTGGLQDQMGFVDEDGNLLDADVHFTADWGSNHDGKYQKHGEWVVPVFPNNLALQGSPPTPYIFDDRCDWREAADKIREVYDMAPEERDRRGEAGREYALNNDFTSARMCQKFIDGIDTVFETWTPKKRFEIFKA